MLIDELRQNHLTGSTWAAYLGLNPYQSPLSAWRINAGLETFEGNEATEIGLFLESGLGRLAQKRLQLGKMTRLNTVAHPDHPEMIAVTPDFLFPRARTGLQIKNRHPMMTSKYLGRPGERGEYDNDLIPIYDQIQCQAELITVSAFYERQGGKPWKIWLLGVYFGGYDFRIYRIRRHADLIAGMMKAGTAFWCKHLDPSGPCLEPDNSTWKKVTKEPPKIPKLTAEELAAAPIPFL